MGRGNLRANGHPNGGPWRQWHGVACGGYFLETYGTLVHGKRVPAERIVYVVASLAEGLGIRAVARVFAVDPNTVLQWLVETADHLQAFSQYFLHDVRVTQVQLDELYAVVSAVKAGQVSEGEAIERLSRSPHWVGGQSIRSASCCWRSTSVSAPWPWRNAWSIRSWRGWRPAVSRCF